MRLPMLVNERTQPLLSFAIPTYNFGKFIGQTIRSIIEGAMTLKDYEYEIVVLDGGSDDDTSDVVTELALQFRNIKYKKNPVRGGIDRDLNEVAGMATGMYVWLFSADDLLVEGWDCHIAPLLKLGKDAYLVPAELCDYYMGHLRNNPIFAVDNKDPIQFDFDGESKSIEAYLERANTLEALFSFMSAVIVKNDVWHKLKDRPDYYGSCWAHCAKLLPLLFNDATIVYVNKYMIKKRGGNDSFMENGFVSRIGLAVNGWGRIIFEFFKVNSQRNVLFQLLRKDMPMILFIYAKISAKDKQEVKRLDAICRDLYLNWSVPIGIKIHYAIYRLVPGATMLNRILEPYLPLIIRVRHKIKARFNK